MENGYDEGKLAGKMSDLALFNKKQQQQPSSSSPRTNNIDHDNDHNLFQVIKAVEAAEATIKQQVEENTRLRNELLKKMQELENYKLDETVGIRHNADGTSLEQSHKTYEAHHSVLSVSNEGDSIRDIGNTFQPSTSAPHIDRKLDVEGAEAHSHTVSHSGDNNMNGTLKNLPGGQMIPNNSSMSQLSSPSTTSFSPRRYEVEDHDQQSNFSGQGLMQMAETNNSNHLWKQDLMQKIRQHEEEINLLRKHLAEYSLKESQICNEKYVLEKRVAYMRLAFDQQQQDLIDAASKALSYRQDIIEENIRLTYALQAAQEERTTFASSLLPLLAEYSLQPPSPDAQSIVSHVKVLFKHLQEKLRQTELKLKEAQYQLTPWRADINHSNMALQSPSLSLVAAVNTPNKDGLELVPRPTFSHEKMPISSEATSDWDILSRHQSAITVGMMRNPEPDDIGRYSPLVSRNPAVHDSSAQIAVSHTDRYAAQYGEEATSKQVTFREPLSHTEMDDYDADGQQNEQEQHTNWAPGTSSYNTQHQDQGLSYSPYLPPVPEDPSSSYSEAADDDPLPAIDGLQISGDALPGHELQACGYSINGTTSCNFEWIRHLEDGSVNYIEGAKQPNYLVTADDVNTYLAIEVQPLDNRKRKGELVRVFANEHQKIACDPEMQRQIEKNFNDGLVSYKVSVPTGYLDIWEPATLAIKREGYSIKCSGSSGDVSEKFTRDTRVEIPYGQPAEFVIVDSNGGEHFLRTDMNADISCWRDTIVLTLRLFIMRAGEKRKGKKKGLFFHK